MNKKPIILIGGGGHCISCIEVVEQSDCYSIVGIIDLPEKVGQTILSYPVIGTDNEIENFIKECPNFLITVGQIKSSKIRQTIYQNVKNAGGIFPVIVSPYAHVSKHATIGEGTIIMHHALVNAEVNIGKCSIINSKSLVEHETFVGNFCHISTGAILNGQVKIGNNCFIGSNTVVSNNLAIENNTIISAGSQVLKNISESGIYIGNPIRKIS